MSSAAKATGRREGAKGPVGVGGSGVLPPRRRNAPATWTHGRAEARRGGELEDSCLAPPARKREAALEELDRVADFNAGVRHHGSRAYRILFPETRDERTSRGRG